MGSDGSVDEAVGGSDGGVVCVSSDEVSEDVVVSLEEVDWVSELLVPSESEEDDEVVVKWLSVPSGRGVSDGFS